MELKRGLGIILFLFGVGLVFVSLGWVNFDISVFLPQQIKLIYVTVVGGVIALIGLLLMVGKKKGEEGIGLPIFKGNRVVGYRVD